MRTARVIRLREHQTTRAIPLTPQEHADLERSDARLTLRLVALGVYDVTATEVVGSFSTSRLRVVIEPKVEVRRLLALLAFTTVPIEFKTNVRSEEQTDLLTVMQDLYATTLDQALGRGLLHAYEGRADRLHAVRGRIDVTVLVLRRFGVFPPLDCTFDEHTADIEVNRRLLAAAVLLARHGHGSPTAHRLMGLAARMGEVRETTYAPGDVKPLALDRRFDRVRVALSLAEIVLRHGSIELRDGVAESLGFLVDMNRLFEDIVVEGLRPFLRSSGVWLRQPPQLRLDEGGTVPIRPDAVLFGRRGGPAMLVLDVKYKATEDAKNQDLYQLTAYSHALGASRAALVYADVTPQTLRVCRGGPTIELHRLGLDREPDELRADLRSLAVRLNAFVEQAPEGAPEPAGRPAVPAGG